MVGWVHEEEGLWLPRAEEVRVRGLSLLEAALPPGPVRRQGRQGGRLLRRRGVKRALAPEALGEELAGRGVVPVSPVPLCRALGDRLALALLEDLPLRRRAVALRGEGVTAAARALALALCPEVGVLLLDLGRGQEELEALLRSRYGAPTLPLGLGPPPRVTVELSQVPPREEAGQVLRLWGRPHLAGLTVTDGEPVPAGMEPLPLLELLWETGRRELRDLQVARKP